MKTCKLCHQPTYKLDDWVDGVPDAWDYEAVLSKYGVEVTDLGVDEEDVPTHNGHSLSWKNGFMHVPTDDETHAKKAAALFIELWLRGVSASFADELMDGYLSNLELQDK